jgi:signal transduction histidine kinase
MFRSTWLGLAFCTVTAVAVSWAIYRVRLRQITHTLTTRFDLRLSEQTRLARDLHDTLLQTVQGAKMVADQALEPPQDVVGMRQSLQQVSTWLGQAAAEGRTSVHSLRASSVDSNELAEALRRAIVDCDRLTTMTGEVSVVGIAQDLHPVVRDEVYRIGYEAIRNACVHSHGTRLAVTLIYGKDLTLRVADNGAGIDRMTAAQGRPGHFGLQGMRDRAGRIGAAFAVAGETQGTLVMLTVPGRAIFSRPPT